MTYWHRTWGTLIDVMLILVHGGIFVVTVASLVMVFAIPIVGVIWWLGWVDLPFVVAWLIVGLTALIYGELV